MVDIYVSSGVTKSNVVTTPGNPVWVKSGGTINGATVGFNGMISLELGAIHRGTVTVNGGIYHINGTTTGPTILNAGGQVSLYGGTTQNAGGEIHLSGGQINTYKNAAIVYTAAGGTVAVQSGATQSFARNLVAGNTTFNILSGGKITGTDTSIAGWANASLLQSGNRIVINPGGTLAAGVAGLTVSAGASILVNGRMDANTTLLSGAIMTVSASATWGNMVTVQGGQIDVFGTRVNARFGPGGGVINLYNAGTVPLGNNMFADAATVNVYSGSTYIGGVSYSGNVINIMPGGQIGAHWIGDGSTVNAVSGKILADGVTIRGGGKAFIGPNTGGKISLAGSTNGGLTIMGLEAGGTLTTQITDFDGTAPGNSDAIKIAGVRAADVASVSYPDADYVVFTLKNGSIITLNIVGAKAAGYSLSDTADGNLLYETCYLAGNMITTPDGMRAVETLAVGDRVSVLDAKSGKLETRVIVWTGQKTVQTQSSPALDGAVDRGAYPVRILKNALAPNMPSQDMLITPEHCLCLDGRLVPVRMLVNDRSIFYDRSFESYTYYHIETEDHCLIWANNVLTETYLDTGNRTMFDGDRSMYIPAAHGQSAAPIDVSIDFVQPLHKAILDRAIVQGVRPRSIDPVLTGDPGLYLLTDRGTVLENRSTNPGVAKFALPSGVHSVRLVSRSARPCDTLGPFVDDRRRLGILVGGITLFSSQTAVDITTHLSRDFPGWHTCEHGPVRWTDGFAFLPLPQDSVTHGSSLAIEVRAVTEYRLEEEEPEALSA